MCAIQFSVNLIGLREQCEISETMHRMLARSNFEGQYISCNVDRHLEWKEIKQKGKKKAYKPLLKNINTTQEKEEYILLVLM